MKNYIKVLLLAMTAMVASCQYELVPLYSGDSEIYFWYADGGGSSEHQMVDSIFVHFGYDNVIKSDSLFRVRIRIQGNNADYDRPVAFKLDTGSTARLGEDVELLPELSFVPANSNEGYVTVRLKNTTNLNKKILRANIRLIANEHFRVAYTQVNNESYNANKTMDATRYKIDFDNDADKPELWAKNDRMFTLWFGNYSNKKFALMLELCNMERSYFMQNDDDPPGDKFTMAVYRSICRIMNDYLRAYEAEHGEPLLDEDGNPMTMGENAASL